MPDPQLGTRLEAVLAGARAAEVRRDVAERFVDELERWSRRDAATRTPARRRAWVLFGAAAMAAMAVVAVVSLWTRLAPPPERVADLPHDVPVALEPLRLPGVAVIAASDTRYQVVSSGPQGTELALRSGRLVVRAWPGHSVQVDHQTFRASADGAVFRIARVPSTTTAVAVEVVAGAMTIETRDPGAMEDARVERVGPGARWPADQAAVFAASDQRAVTTLQQCTAFDLDLPSVPPPDADLHLDAGSAAADPASSPARRALGARPGPDAPPGVSIKDRWRHARLLRAQADFAGALAECDAIADAHDPTWSPIALVEAARIYLGPLDDLEHVLTTTSRFFREYPTHALTRDVRELRCRALAQLGRGNECAGSTR